MQDVFCKMQHVSCDMQDAICKVRDLSCKVRDALCELQNAKGYETRARCAQKIDSSTFSRAKRAEEKETSTR